MIAPEQPLPYLSLETGYVGESHLVPLFDAAGSAAIPFNLFAIVVQIASADIAASQSGNG